VKNTQVTFMNLTPNTVENISVVAKYPGSPDLSASFSQQT
jgi:hypothetical protein